MTNRIWTVRALAMVIGVVLPALIAQSTAAQDFYAGKTITCLL
jgi:uncharacterized membrane-anchored protein YhcB (DUF1043 family)